jgi:hypothetical protein
MVVAKISGKVGVVGDDQWDLQLVAVINSPNAEQRRFERMQNIRLELLQLAPHRSPRKRDPQLRIQRERNRRHANHLCPA